MDSRPHDRRYGEFVRIAPNTLLVVSRSRDMRTNQSDVANVLMHKVARAVVARFGPQDLQTRSLVLLESLPAGPMRIGSTEWNGCQLLDEWTSTPNICG
ncbi:hypothetical protein [Variovorax sp. YR216]|uniref:hypothetical protein n=1 Tax=Variovorax sp. YR216 TaxID=1882828 RepID=UPI00115FA56F|nr:hypothetical protein [Variovorax sp. YR216]